MFIDGCFWHGCPIHGKKAFGGPNADLWQAKIARTKMRDRRQTKVAKDLGWTVLRFWECDVSGDAMHVAEEIARLVHARSNR